LQGGGVKRRSGRLAAGLAMAAASTEISHRVVAATLRGDSQCADSTSSCTPLLATRAGKDCFEHRTQAVHCGGARAPYRCASHLSAHLAMLIKAALSRRNDMNADGKKFATMRANRSARLLQNTCTVPEEARAQMSCIRNGGPRARAKSRIRCSST